MSGLRIALIASNRFPIAQPFAGGLEAHVWHLTQGLIDAGHHVTLFAAEGSDTQLNCTEMPVRELHLSAAAISDPAMTARPFLDDHHAYLSLMMALANADHDRFDVIHNHSLHYLPIAQAPSLSIPMICTLHTPPTPWLESAVAITGGDNVRYVAVSRHTSAAWGALVPDIDVVPNGIDSGLWPFAPGGSALVWIGRITPEKGPHVAIEAARRAGRSLTLAGPVSNRRYFDTEVAPRLDENIRYAGHLPHRELATLVGGSAAALITPMWDEPYGLVVAEAMSCGTPVVSFARGGIPEIVDDACGRLIPPGDVDAMAAAIPEAESMDRATVRHCALTRCSAEAMLDRYLTIYYRTINAQRVKSHDRVLHSSQWQGTPRTGIEHRGAPVAAGHGVDVSGAGRSPSVRRDSAASA